MATEIKVPTLGESVTTATIARWLKQPGDAVAADEPLVELETDKVTVEVNAPAAGRLGAHFVAEGAEVEVGTLLSEIVDGVAAAAAPVAPPPAAITPPAGVQPPSQPPSLPPSLPAATDASEGDASAAPRSPSSSSSYASSAR